MIKLNGQVTDQMNFFQGADPFELIEEYGSPLYVYNERILRQRLREMKNLVSYENFRVNYSAKANSNLGFLQIVRSEGVDVDAMSPGEIYIELMAGFSPENILYISNNVSPEEMSYAVERGVKVSVDSVSQLETYGRLNPGGNVAVRFNPGVGAGHHAKVITGGKNTKFGVNPEYIPQIKDILERYSLKLIGLNQHIGSLFMNGEAYVEAAENMLEIAGHFSDLEFIDLGGGFGIPYKKQDGESPMNLKALGEKMEEFIDKFVSSYGKKLIFKIEPGRYISAECGLLLGTAHAVKYNGKTKYIGTDIGFNTLMRPAMYDSYHGIEVYTKRENPKTSPETVTVVGNICETGDILAANRLLPPIVEKDIIGVLDAGAYGFTMSSNYNNRLRCAEIFIMENGKVCLTRERDTYQDIVMKYIPLL